MAPDSGDRDSLTDEFPFLVLEMPSPQFHALESITRDMQHEMLLINFAEEPLPAPLKIGGGNGG